jgi:Undecaprenyl-phosphate glucose phosphotransferase
MSLVWVASFYIRFSGFFPLDKGKPDLVLYLKLIPFIGFSWFLAYLFLKPVSSPAHRNITFDEVLWLLRICLLSTLIFIVFSYFYNEYKYSSLVLFIFLFLQFFSACLLTTSLNYFFRKNQKNIPPRRILVIGSGKNLATYTKSLMETKPMVVEILGVILMGKEKDQEDAKTGLIEEEFTLIEEPNDWVSFLIEKKCEEVMLSFPPSSYEQTGECLKKLIHQVSSIKIIPDTLALSEFQCDIEFVGAHPCLSVHKNPLESSHGVLTKRILDILGSLFACLLFALPAFLIALVIKLTSKGPVLFTQERIGLDGRPFHILKFRTMKEAKKSESDKIWTTKQDARCTWVGKILRKTSLDEIPQFINVLTGDMSLVGPRPERPHFVHEFRQHIPQYMLRHRVKAGITGWAQINGYRGDTDIKKRIEYDLHYIQNWSLSFDFKILIKTLYVGFYNRNAY